MILRRRFLPSNIAVQRTEYEAVCCCVQIMIMMLCIMSYIINHVCCLTMPFEHCHVKPCVE
jgi:hypothetical protein